MTGIDPGIVVKVGRSVERQELEFTKLASMLADRFDELVTETVAVMHEHGRLVKRRTRRMARGAHLYSFTTVESELMGRNAGAISLGVWLLEDGSVFAEAGFDGVALPPAAYVERVLARSCPGPSATAPLKVWRLDGLAAAVAAMRALAEDVRLNDIRNG